MLDNTTEDTLIERLAVKKATDENEGETISPAEEGEVTNPEGDTPEADKSGNGVTEPLEILIEPLNGVTEFSTTISCYLKETYGTNRNDGVDNFIVFKDKNNP
jgi:hypothetical protein